MVLFDTAILNTFGEIARRAHKAYVYPSQKTIISLCDRYQGVKRSRRELNRRLEFLDDAGFFRRVRRHKRSADGSLVLRSTLYKLRGKFFRWMGWAGSRLVAFARVFAVPFMAQYPATTKQVSVNSLPGGVEMGESQVKGGPSGTSSPAFPPPSVDENLRRVREVVKKIGG